jgi:hypothetical protein
MNNAIIAVVVVAVLVLGWMMFFRSDPAPAKPATSTATPEKSMGVVDGIQMQIDFKAKAAVAVKVATQTNSIKQLLAMEPIDSDAARNALATQDDLEKEVARTRDQLVTGGESQASVDAWLERQHWNDLKELATQLRAKSGG